MTDQPPAPPEDAAGAPTGSGASTWTGVAPVVERPADVGAPPPPPPTATEAAAGVGGPPAGGPPAGGPPAATGRGKGPLVVIALVVIAALAAGAFFLLGGDDDGDDEVAADDTTTTTEQDDEATTTTTEADDQGDDEATTTTAADGDPLGAFTFTQAQDDTGTLVVEVPDIWETDGRPLGSGSPNLQAATSLDGFRGGFASSGISFTRLDGTPDPDATIDFLISNNNLQAGCSSAEDRQDYTDGVFTGRSQKFTGCSSSDATIFEIVASRADGATVEVTVAIVSPDPEELIQHIADTFNLTS